MEECGLSFLVSFTFSQVSKNVAASTALRGKFGSMLVPRSGRNQGYQSKITERHESETEGLN